MTYKYLYQDRQNRNCEGEIKARDRNDAYLQLRKQGIRPYRVIGDDPLNWRPWAIATGYAVLLALVFVLAAMLAGRAHPSAPSAPQLSADEAAAFRARAVDAVYRAPEAFRYNVWKGVNARLAERGLEPLPRPEGLRDEEQFP
jgi:hypothetical protein